MMSRRSLLGAATAWTAASYNRVLGANDRIRIGIIGLGARGPYLTSVFLQSPDVEIAAVCDVFGDRVDRALSKTPDSQAFSDHRKLLDLRALDAVVIATPDHWHAQIAIDAFEAGKDVYLEKPVSRTLEEGQRVVRSARERNRICQVGLQQRSGPTYIQARDEIVKAGKLGKIVMARTWGSDGPRELKVPAEMQTCPSNLDWVKYLGPLQRRDWDARQYLYYRAYLDYGGGMVTDLFTHWVDVVHMFLNQDDPVTASAAGGNYIYKDGRTAPDTVNLVLEYRAGFNVTFDWSLAAGAHKDGQEFLGTDGSLYIDRGGFEHYQQGSNQASVAVKASRDQTIDHVENFLDCLRTRRQPNADAQTGHRASVAAMLGMIAYAQKRRIQYDPAQEQVLA
jgi:predicted dehydrogenase